MARIGLVGFGGIGIETAKVLVQDPSITCDIVAFDRKEAVDAVPGPIRGAYEEILDAIGILRTGGSIRVTADVADLEGCDAFVFTAGLPRRADQSRADLIGVNVGIVAPLAKKIGQVARGAFMVMVTNPLDAMVEIAYRNLGYPDTHVVGQAGVLDTGRFTVQASMATGVPCSQIDTVVLGGHGPDMVPVYSHARVAHTPLSAVLSGAEVETITESVRDRGRYIIQKQGRSAVYSTAVAAVKMVKAYLLDTREIMPACTRLHGEYGYDGIFGGVPTMISRAGVKPVEIPLTPSEKAELDKSMAAVKSIVDEMDSLL